ncbi:hypothetical protein EM6_0498 [Asticcacaulis excentricus]|uniref:Uncharacterized protein n=1 Tax=Asticcacaulis excentricus TaxID=78587 RepID=A0A3G9G2E9_9CAUL|nr:hypothetical protein EM6_0498 [Asticcacaulis excentricus]
MASSAGGSSGGAKGGGGGGGSSLAGSAINAFASLLGAFNANNAAKARARQLRMEADRINMEAGRSAMEDMRQSSKAEASGFVSAAAGGGFTGSAIDVMNEFVGDSLYNARALIYQGQTQARNALYEANVARAEGKNALIGGVLNAGASLLGGYGQYRESRGMASTRGSEGNPASAPSLTPRPSWSGAGYGGYNNRRMF